MTSTALAKPSSLHVIAPMSEARSRIGFACAASIARARMAAVTLRSPHRCDTSPGQLIGAKELICCERQHDRWPVQGRL